MKAQSIGIMALGMALAAEPTWADRARARDSGSSSSSSSSRSSAPARHGGSSRSSSTSSDDRSDRPRSTAQRRHPRAGRGRGSHHRRGYRPRYYRPNRYYWGWDGPYYYGGYRYWPYYGGYGYSSRYGLYSPGIHIRYSRRDLAGAVRLMVQPSETRVYVNGYYAGVVDDYDGLLQRLRLPTGRHEVTLKLTGHRTHRLRLYISEGHTLKIRHDMLLGEGEDLEYFGGDDDERWERDRWADDERWAPQRDRQADDDRKSEGARDDVREREPAPGTEKTLVRLAVLPADAAVYVDGRFRGSGGGILELELRPGLHRVEVVRPGYRTVDREIEVPEDDPLTVEVEMERL